MGEHRKTDIEEAVEELLTDPDSPDMGDTEVPQTIDAEPGEADKNVR